LGLFSKKKELDIPPAAQLDSEAVEIARIWVTGGRQEVCLRTGIWDDPAAWGILLVDLAKHVANAYEQGEGLQADEVLGRIRAGFDCEWESPTDRASGEIIN